MVPAGICLIGLVTLLGPSHDPQTTATRLGTAEVLEERILYFSWSPGESTRFESRLKAESVAAARAALEAESLVRPWSAGRELPPDQAHGLGSGCGIAAARYNRRMPTTSAAAYKGQRFPAEIIAHAVWRTFRFPLSYRQVVEILAVHGIVVSYEAIREEGRTFGQTYANALHRQRSQPGDKWHLAEVFLQIS